MRLFVLCAVLLLAGCGVSGCGSTALNGQNQFISAISEIAKDPTCGHTDRIDIDLGLTGSHGKLFLERACPIPAPAPAPKPSQ